MLSAAARAFAAAPRTPAGFRDLANAEPQTAASWLLRFANSAGITGGPIQQLEGLKVQSFDSDTSRAAAFAAFFAQNPAVADMVDLANLQAERAATLGFTVVEPAATVKNPALLTGTVKLTNGVVQLDVGGRTFNVDSPNWQASLQFEYFEANALGAFVDKTVTVKAYPTAAETLAVEEFSPGVGQSFVSGRLQMQGDQIGIRVRPDKWVAIRDPEMQTLLKGYAKLGVIIPGKLVQEGAQFFLEPSARDFWMLAANAQFGAAPIANTVAMAHGQSHPVQGDISTTTPTRRVLIYGRIADDATTVVAKKALAAPEVKHENGIAFSNDSKALAALTPVELPETAPEGFEA